MACGSNNTKLTELRFRAWLTEDGTRQIELVRAHRGRPSPRLRLAVEQLTRNESRSAVQVRSSALSCSLR